MTAENQKPEVIDVLAMGKRIASYRKYAGIKTARELAERINNPKITTTVIQNIESGRKLEPSVSQLLDIAEGIGISPLFLLMPIGRPFDKVDISGVGPAVAAMKIHEFESWVSVTGKGLENESEQSQKMRRVLDSLRELFDAVEKVREASINPALNAQDESFELEAEDGSGVMVTHTHSPSSWAYMELENQQMRVDKNYSFLNNWNVDLSWVKRPWAEKSE